MRYSIYKITCLVNNKVYIGYSKHSAEERFKIHLSNKRSKGSILHNALMYHGKEKFTVDEIDYAYTVEEAWEKEKLWISIYKSNHSRYPNNGYNMTDGGEGITGYVATEEHRKNLSIANTGKVMPDWVKDKISKSHKSRDGLSDKQKDNLSNLHEKRRKENSYDTEKMITPESMYKKRKTMMIKTVNRLLENSLVGFLIGENSIEDIKTVALEQLEIDNLRFIEKLFTCIYQPFIDIRQDLNAQFGAVEINRRSGDIKRNIKSIQEMQELYKEVS